MGLSPFYEAELRIQHRHRDGSWGEFEEDVAHHDAAAHDPERRWARGRVFRCTTCEEAVTVNPVDATEGGASS
jgi:hypothetical protein